jgi:hypothetical protein
MDDGTAATAIPNLNMDAFRTAYTSRISKQEIQLRLRSEMESATAAPSNQIVFDSPYYESPEFALAQLTPLVNDASLIVGFYAARTISAIRTLGGQLEELDAQSVKFGETPPWRSFMIRMDANMIPTAHRIFTATEALTMKGATVQRQEGETLSILVHGEFKGDLSLGPTMLTAPTIHDFAASVSW